ncbi:MAG: hypothetical protein AAF497_02880 [Planctomycetota bacterium]
MILALTKRAALCVCFVIAIPSSLTFAASHRTQNFIVTTTTPHLAREVCEMAEVYRRDLAIEWLGHELPPWGQPCPITVDEGPHLGAGGSTSFMFEGGQPFGWRMSIQGSRQRLLDSVLPHEVTHTVFATHFGCALPRWADEGACTTVEHPEEKQKQQQFLMQFLTSNPPRSIPFNKMFRMTEYPHDIMPLYAQGHSVAQFLIHQGGKRKFIDYVGSGMEIKNWDQATKEYYDYRDLSELQIEWVKWVSSGSPAVNRLADARGNRQPQIANASFNQPLADEEPFRASRRTDLESVPNLEPVPGDQQLGMMPQPHSVASMASGSWYARQRDERDSTAKQQVPPPLPRNGTFTAQEPWLPGSSRTASPGLLRAMAARPQPTQGPSQRVLEWNQPSVAVGPGVQLRRSGPPPAGIYMDPRPTMWR